MPHALQPLACLVAVAAVACFVLPAGAEDFNAGRTHLLDMYTNSHGVTNFLFRGNNPKENNSFALSALNASLAEVAHKEGNTSLPASYQLVDISMLIGLDPKEHDDLKLEEDFFKNNPSVGKFINWPLLTDLLGPCVFSASKRKSMASSGKWDTDDVPAKVLQLRSMLESDSTTPVVTYIHCEAGVDRTGEMSGSYLMRFQNQTYAEVLAFDDKVEPRPISKASENGLKWFSLYMEYTQGFNPGFTC